VEEGLGAVRMGVDTLRDAICRSEEFRQWQARLTECFFNEEEKRRLIREVRQAVAAQAAGLAPDDVEAVQGEVVRRLVGLASNAAGRPEHPEEPRPRKRTPQQIEDLVIDCFPYPIATCYRAFTEQQSPAGRFGCLLDTFESLVHYLATVLVSQYWRDGAWDATHNKRLLEKFYKGKWATGDLMEVVCETARVYVGRPDTLPYPQLVPYLFLPDGKPSPSLQVLKSFVTLRNEAWGHRGGRADEFYADILGENERRLAEELNRCEWLTARALYRPKEIDDEGVVTRADLLMGDRIRSNREVCLRLDPEDLDPDTGDVKGEYTLLLVDTESGAYLPLFPLSLFRDQLHGSTVFFLDDLDWADRLKTLRRARYKPYEPRNPRLEPHRAERGTDPEILSLEAKVRRLGEPPEGAVRALAVARPDYDLPQVWAEQEYHVKAFVGRTSWLRRLEEWVDRSVEGGYLLLVGPPGQGKSALMAQFAFQQGAVRHPQPAAERRVLCLLHMAKSHRNPERFLQFLLWQVERVLGESQREDAYRGGVDDLRNALVWALEQARRRFERVVVVIDALDELDPFWRQVTFLPEHLPEGVCVVLSCRPDIPLVNTIRRRLHPLTTVKLSPFDESDLQLFLEKQLEVSGVRELSGKVDFQALFRKTGGNPLFLKRAVDRILAEVRRAREAGRPVPIMDASLFPGTAEAVFEDIYNEIAEKVDGRFTTESGQRKARLAQLLSVAFEPLSADQLRDLLHVSTGTRLDLEQTRDLLMQMSEYLLIFEGERVLLYHQGFADYIHRRVLGDEGLAERHQDFCRWLEDGRQRGSSYGLRYLPAHLTECWQRSERAGREVEAQWAKAQLRALLTDLQFIEMKVQAGWVFDLVRDYQRTLPLLGTDSELEEWARFVDSQTHVLAQFPHLVLQQALNQPVESSVARAAEEARRTGRLKGQVLRWVNRPRAVVPSPHLRTLVGHRVLVMGVAVTPDGKRVVSGGWDGTVRVWDLRTGACVAVFPAMGMISTAAVATQGRLVASDSLGYVYILAMEGQE